VARGGCGTQHRLGAGDGSGCCTRDAGKLQLSSCAVLATRHAGVGCTCPAARQAAGAPYHRLWQSGLTTIEAAARPARSSLSLRWSQSVSLAAADTSSGTVWAVRAVAWTSGRTVAMVCSRSQRAVVGCLDCASRALHIQQLIATGSHQCMTQPLWRPCCLAIGALYSTSPAPVGHMGRARPLSVCCVTATPDPSEAATYEGVAAVCTISMNTCCVLLPCWLQAPACLTAGALSPRAAGCCPRLLIC
jgi:hypothetical protein